MIKDQTISSDKSEDNIDTEKKSRRYSDSILDPEDKKKSAKKSVVNQLSTAFATHQRNINKSEHNVFEKLFKSLRDTKDHYSFCKLLHIYFIGILPLKDFVTLYENKF